MKENGRQEGRMVLEFGEASTEIVMRDSGPMEDSRGTEPENTKIMFTKANC